jgi:hypothetical protein
VKPSPANGSASTLLLLVALMAALMAALPALPSLAARTPLPEPPPGETVNVLVALIRFQRAACDQGAGKVLEFWAQAQSADQDLARDFVLKNLGADLASGRAAADIIGRLMPRVRAENGAETDATIRRLAATVTKICDEVALPTGPLAQFRARLNDIYERIDLEESELGRLVVLPDARSLDLAIEPYLVPLQMAAIDAEAEYLAYLQSLRPKERKITLTEQIVGWHQAVYTPAVTPTKTLLGRFLQARAKNDGPAMAQTCRELSAASIALMRQPQVFKAPGDAKIEDPLKRSYIEIRGMATECAAGRFRETEAHYAAMQTRLQEAATILSRYGLRP